MSLTELIGFLALTGAAAYAQTLTGFAFGLITMGGIGLTGLLSLPDAAMIVSVLTLINAAQMLFRGWRDVAWREFGFVMAASVPMLFAGYALLQWLAGTRSDLLRLLLGVIIVISSLQLARRPEPVAQRSGAASFLFFGGIAGLMGGLFSTAGPPLVYHFYRQPITLETVRDTLLALFGIGSIVRLAMVVPTGQFTLNALVLTAFAVPVVMIVTWWLKHHPPAWRREVVLRIVCALLVATGIGLVAPALHALF